jgi:hypothetical protein
MVVQGAGDLDEYQGLVIGRAAVSTYRLKDAASLFVRDNRELLAQRPVCLFSRGPLAAITAGARAVVLSRAVVLPEGGLGDRAQLRGWARWMAQEPAQPDPALEDADAQSMKRVPDRRLAGRPVAPSSMRRTGRLNRVGGAFVFLGLLALLLGAPLTFMLALWISGTFFVGVGTSVFVGGLGVLMLVANWVVLGLSERTPAEREQSRRERDRYEAAAVALAPPLSADRDGANLAGS